MVDGCELGKGDQIAAEAASIVDLRNQADIREAGGIAEAEATGLAAGGQVILKGDEALLDPVSNLG